VTLQTGKCLNQPCNGKAGNVATSGLLAQSHTLRPVFTISSSGSLAICDRLTRRFNAMGAEYQPAPELVSEGRQWQDWDLFPAAS
jgi:hypothetical protein